MPSQSRRTKTLTYRWAVGSEPDEIVPAMAILANVAYPTLRDANSESTSKEQFYGSL